MPTFGDYAGLGSQAFSETDVAIVIFILVLRTSGIQTRYAGGIA